jgi:hypothetical protein
MQLIPTATDANFILDKIRPGTASTLAYFHTYISCNLVLSPGAAEQRGQGGEGAARDRDHGLVPNSHIHTSESVIYYIPRIGPPIFYCSQIRRQTDRGNI